MKRARLIMNPVSGGEQPNPMMLPDIVAAMEAEEIRVDLTFTSLERSPTEIARQAVTEGYDMIVVGGGDGTVSEVAKGLLYAPIPLGIVPIGTYNNIARSLGLPTELAAACQVLSQGQIKTIDVGQANDEHIFFEAAGVGLDAALFPLGADFKEGRWERILQAAQLALLHKPERVLLHFDRSIADAKTRKARSAAYDRLWRRKALQRHELHSAVSLVVVANGPYYGAGFTVAPDACMDDGLLTVSVFRGFSKWELLRHFGSITRGQYRHSPKIEIYQAAELRLTSPKAKMPVHVDGTRIGELPVSFKALKQVLRVLVPTEPTQIST